MSNGAYGVNFQDAIELIGLCATILGCTWKLSGSLSDLKGTINGVKISFDAHVRVGLEREVMDQ